MESFLRPARRPPEPLASRRIEEKTNGRVEEEEM
jgi:hypothetical protein